MKFKRLLYFIIVFFACFFFTSCDKEQELNADYSIIVAKDIKYGIEELEQRLLENRRKLTSIEEKHKEKELQFTTSKSLKKKKLNKYIKTLIKHPDLSKTEIRYLTLIKVAYTQKKLPIF